MKKQILFFAWLLCSALTYAQVTNVGSLVIAKGSHVVIKGSMVNTPRNSSYYANKGNIYIAGDFFSNQSVAIADSGTTTFNGTSLQSIQGSNSMHLYNVIVNNFAGVQLQQPLVVNGSLTIAGGNLSINGKTLTLNGITAFTAGSLKGSASSNLVIGGNTTASTTIRLNAAAGDSLLRSLTINRAGGNITLGSQVGITKLLSLTAGNLNMNGKVVTLKSVSIDSTALVGPVGGSIDYTNGGSFTVERIIPDTPTNKRVYRDIGPGVYTTSSVFQNWQENGSSPIGYGIYITGIKASTAGVDAASGLDKTISGNYSMHTYANGAWANVANTKTLIPDPYQGYRVLVRGDRTFNMNVTPEPTTMNRATVIRTNGKLITGTVTFSATGVSGSFNSTYHLNTNSLNAYTLIANPYACAIDWTTLAKTNLVNTYWYIDPTIGTSGSYVTCDGNITSNPFSRVNQYIQPGQAFFVRNNNSINAQLQISESNKVVNVPLTQVFKTSAVTNRLYIGLFKTVAGNKVNLDGAAALFDTAYANDYVFGEDAGKITNTYENMAWYRSATNISIEKRATANTTDTLPIRLWQLTAGTAYSVMADARTFTGSLQPYIWDKYTNTTKVVTPGDTTSIVFTPTANTDTYQNRFYIIFSNTSVLPVHNLTVHATAKEQTVNVQWNLTKEEHVASYQVERSADAQTFQVLGTVKAVGATGYQYTDNTPVAGNNYYRIRVSDKDGSIYYSKVALATFAGQNSIRIFPNPVTNGKFSLTINQPQARYSVRLYNTAGQLVLLHNIEHRQATGMYEITLNSTVAKGLYRISVTAAAGEVWNETLQIN